MKGQPPRTVYPGHADYDLAVDNVHQFVFDSVLKAGRPQRRRDGGPLYYLGGFAKAYVIDCRGKTYALRVWLSDIGDAARRYAAVSQYCGQARLPIFVEDFTYVPGGILVNGHRFPLLRMEWVKGETLGDFISGRLGDGAVLRTAAEEFLAMVRTLHERGIAHGDLQSDNMLVSRAPGGSVTFKLIDYDTLMVPALKGWAITSTGLPCYQHPRRGESGLATVRDDYFSELVIYLSLLAVAENPNLWRQHPAPPVKREKELLFVPEDFTAPHPTPVFLSLHRHGGLVRSLAVALWNFTRCRSIGDLIPLERVLEQARAAEGEADESFDRRLKRLMAGAGTSPHDLFDDTAFPRPVRPPPATERPTESFESKIKRMASAPAAPVVDESGPKAGDWRVAVLGGGVTLELCGIPAGRFTMGGTGPDETPHEVTMTRPFRLGRTPVTQAQWEAVMGSNPSNFKGKDLPVEMVSWDDATDFCKKLNSRGLLPSGWHWTLPTEAQWEYACRAGTTGDYAGTLAEMAWCYSNSGFKAHAVGTKKANAWGLHDMHGNVWEWCADWYGNYANGVATDPTGANNGTSRVNRGGSWRDADRYCRSANRDWSSPDARYHYIGFRVAAVSGERKQRDDRPVTVHVPVTVPVPVATVPETPANTGWTAEQLAALAAAVVVLILIGGGSWLGSGSGKATSQPTAEEQAENAAAAVALGSGWVGRRQVFALGGGQRFAVCFVPAGTFTMGGTGSDETPHSVTLGSPFWMGATEVTQGQWQAVMGTNPSTFKGDELPVETVSWDDAQKYVEALNERAPLQDGWKWTLPTEAQWEYACRAGTTREYAGALAEMAWYDSNSGSKTHPVGTKKANAWGLFDMHGNVWEWCADWYGDYPKGAVTDPTGPNNGSYRLNRGGSWINGGAICRSAYRTRGAPGYRLGDFGFRVAAVSAEREPAGAGATASGAGARDERAAPLAGASAADLAVDKAGQRREGDLGSGVKLELCGIPAGAFTMGGSGSDETPHEVTLTKPFWLGRTEVTQAQWEAVMGSNPSNFKGKDLPVETVSWNDARGYVEALNAKGLLPAGWRWTLPSEAQWEYACRAGTTGDYAGTLADMAWYGSNSGNRSHPVGAKKANTWGLFDMHGNFWEWCADWYGDYPKGGVTDPTGQNDGSLRVNRGGSWRSGGSYCRSAYRSRDAPDYRDYFIGFRVAAVPAEREPAGAGAAAGGAGARDERAAPLAGASAADLAVNKAGQRREADLGGGAKLELCGIPAGAFTMGGSGSDETPHEVTLTKPFWLGRTEVTQAQWEAVMGSNPSNFKGKDLPVEMVSWNDASGFCQKLNAKGLLPAGWRWTLPSEAHWEYACRAGTTGDYAGTLADMAWYGSNSGNRSHPVGTKEANAWGLFDMHGNVWEWCADWYGDYPKGTVTDPTGSNNGSTRVLRGGSWGSVGSYCRSAARGGDAPGIRNLDIGFRVAAVPGGS